MANSRLEQYLMSVDARLTALPVAERFEQIAELRQHLEQDVAAQIVSGVSPEAAEFEATRQFGSPQKLAWHLQVARWKRMLPKADSLPVATVFAAALVVCQIFDLLPVGRFIRPFFTHPEIFYSDRETHTFWETLHRVAWNPAELIVGILFGCAVAIAAPRQSLKGVLLAGGLFFTTTFLGALRPTETPWMFSGISFAALFAPAFLGMTVGAVVTATAKQQKQRRQSRCLI